MKKFISLILAVFLILSLTSCYAFKEISQEFSYADPQTIGGKWTVSFDNGDVYHDAVCSYWGTTDDTSVWTLGDGSIMIQSGAVHAVQQN